MLKRIGEWARSQRKVVNAASNQRLAAFTTFLWLLAHSPIRLSIYGIFGHKHHDATRGLVYCSIVHLLLAFLLKTSLPSQQLFCAFSSRAVRYIVVFLAFRYYALTRHTPIYGIHGILLKCRGPHELINRFFALPWVAATAIAYRWLPPLIQRNFLLSLFLPTASAGSPP